MGQERRREQRIGRALLCSLLALLLVLAAKGPTLFPSQYSAAACNPSASLWRRPPKPEQRIPRILHHVYWPFKEQAEPASSSESAQLWAESCRLLLCQEAGWECRVWDEAAAEAFIAQHDPGFLQAYKAYKPTVKKLDAVRYYIMKHIGGLYLDGDVECWREGADMLGSYDVVLQAHESKSITKLNNGAMASVAGHPLWDLAIANLKERTDKVVVIATGPVLLTDSVKQLLGITLDSLEGLPPELAHSDGSRIRVYQPGSWYTPCSPEDAACNERTMTARAEGRANLSALVGYHRYTKAWHKPKQLAGGAAILPR